MTADELERAVSLYLASGGSVEVVERGEPVKSQEKAPRTYPAEMVEAIRSYAGKGVVAASKGLGMTTRKINAVAAAHSIDFGTDTRRELERRYKGYEGHLPAIRRMAADNRSQREIAQFTGLSRGLLRGVLKRHGIKTVGKKES